MTDIEEAKVDCCKTGNIYDLFILSVPILMMAYTQVYRQLKFIGNVEKFVETHKAGDWGCTAILICW